MSNNFWRLGASGIAVCGALAATSANAALSIEVLSSRPDLVSNVSRGDLLIEFLRDFR